MSTKNKKDDRRIERIHADAEKKKDKIRVKYEQERKKLRAGIKELEKYRDTNVMEIDDPAKREEQLANTEAEIEKVNEKLRVVDEKEKTELDKIDQITQKRIDALKTSARRFMYLCIASALGIVLILCGIYVWHLHLEDRKAKERIAQEEKLVAQFAQATDGIKIEDEQTFMEAKKLRPDVEKIPDYTTRYPAAIKTISELEKKSKQLDVWKDINIKIEAIQAELENIHEELSKCKQKEIGINLPTEETAGLQKALSDAGKLEQQLGEIKTNTEKQEAAINDIDPDIDIDEILKLVGEKKQSLRDRCHKLRETHDDLFSKISVKRNEAKRMIDLDGFCSVAVKSIDDAKTIIPYDPTKLNTTALASAKELAEQPKEKERVFAIEKDFDDVGKKSIGQHFEQALKNAENSAKEVFDSIPKNQWTPELWEKLDHDSLKRANDLYNRNTESLQHLKAELDRVNNRFVELELGIIGNDFDKLYESAGKSLAEAREKHDETLLKYRHLEEMEKLLEGNRLPFEKKELLVNLRKEFDDFGKTMIDERTVKLGDFVDDHEKELNNKILYNTSLSVVEKFKALETLEEKVSNTIKEVDREDNAGRKTGQDVKDKATKLLETIKDKKRILVPDAVTGCIGNPEEYQKMLATIQKEIPHWRSPDFDDFLNIELKNDYFKGVKNWNTFSEKYGAKIDSSQMSRQSLEEIVKFINNSLDSLEFIPESKTLKKSRGYFLEAHRAWVLYRSNFVEILSKLEKYSNSPYINKFRHKLIALQDTDQVATAQNWHSEMVDLLEKTIKAENEDPVARLMILKTMTTVLSQLDTFFLYGTQNWRYRYGSSYFTRFNWTSFGYRSPDDIQDIAKSLLAVYPIERMRANVKDARSVFKLPSKPDSYGNIGSGYHWIGWIDREGENKDSSAIVRVNKEALRPNYNDGVLYAIISADNDSTPLMQKIGTLTNDQAAINKTNQVFLSGTPVFIKLEDKQKD